MYFLLIRQPPSRLHITEIPYYFSGALDAWQRRIRHWFPPYFAGKTSPASGWCLRAFLWQYIPKHQINELLIWMSVPAITLFRKEAERVKHRFFLFDFLGFWRHMAIWREAAMLERGRRARDPGPRPRRERGERPGGEGGGERRPHDVEFWKYPEMEHDFPQLFPSPWCCWRMWGQSKSRKLSFLKSKFRSNKRNTSFHNCSTYGLGKG